VKFETSSGAPNNDNLFIVNAEVYAGNSGRRFGTSIPGVDTPGTNSASYAVGITVNQDQRANLGCYNESGSSNTVHATVFDASGNQVTTKDLALAGHAWGQTRLDSDLAGGYVQFQPAAPAVCYAVVVNNGTNDGRFVTAVEYTP
jgi:hypothetical protein